MWVLERTCPVIRLIRSWHQSMISSALRCWVLAQVKRTHDRELPMKLRGAFDPRIQFLLGAMMITVFVAILVDLKSSPTDPQIADWLRLDLRVMPISLLLGIVVGLVIGHWRLQALRQVLPEIDGHWFLGQGGVLSKVRQGAN